MESLKFRDPFKGAELEFNLIPIEKLEAIGHQRKSSKYHVANLKWSIERLGFITPIIAFKEKGKSIIIDGQHRLLAARELGIKTLPVIYVPKEYSHLMMNLNIEKEMSIREKAYVALHVYREFLEKKPSLLESDGLIIDSIERPYYVTLGLAYEKESKIAGSSFESLLIRCDLFLDLSLTKTIKIREARAKSIIELDAIAKEIVAKLKELGRAHAFIHKEIISWANPIKRKKLPADFDTVFALLKENLLKLKAKPALFFS